MDSFFHGSIFPCELEGGRNIANEIIGGKVYFLYLTGLDDFFGHLTLRKNVWICEGQ